MITLEDTIHKNRWVILSIVVLLPFMATLDTSIVNIALPSMSKDLSVNMASIEWVVTSYLIAIIALILIFGRLGDIWGKARIFKFGMVTFTFGSMLCGISHSLNILIAARVIQAIGAGAAMANNQGIISQVFKKGERGRALGISGTFVALGSMIGPSLGGLIITFFSWNYIFLVNVPIGIIVSILAYKLIPRIKINNGPREKLDVKGAILFAISISMLFLGANFSQTFGLTSPVILLSLIIGILLLFLFIQYEKKEIAPLLNIKIFENKIFSISVFCSFLSFVSISSVIFIMPFYFLDIRHLTPGLTGILMMIYPLILAIIAPISGHLSDKLGSEILTFLGLLIISIGLFLISFINNQTSLIYISIFIGLVGLGNGLFQSPNISLIMSTVSSKYLGIAGSLNALVRNIGIVFGILFSTSILYFVMNKDSGNEILGSITKNPNTFIDGLKWVFISVSLIALLGSIITLFRYLHSKYKNEVTM